MIDIAHAKLMFDSSGMIVDKKISIDVQAHLLFLKQLTHSVHWAGTSWQLKHAGPT